jgi:hypothetical protein
MRDLVMPTMRGSGRLTQQLSSHHDRYCASENLTALEAQSEVETLIPAGPMPVAENIQDRS